MVGKPRNMGPAGRRSTYLFALALLGSLYFTWSVAHQSVDHGVSITTTMRGIRSDHADIPTSLHPSTASPLPPPCAPAVPQSSPPSLSRAIKPQPRLPSLRGSGRRDNRCKYSEPQFKLAKNGKPCIFPFVLNHTWHNTCARGTCATRVDVLSRAVQVAACTDVTTYEDAVCSSVEVEGTCGEIRDAPPTGTCDTLLGDNRLHGLCRCTGGSSRAFKCDDKETSCDQHCRRVAMHATSSGHSAAERETPADLVVQLSALAAKHAPLPPPKGDNPFVGLDGMRWRAFAEELTKVTPSRWCGRGIAIMAGSVGTLPQAIATVAYIRGHFASNIPVEIWQTQEEATDFTDDFQRGLDQLQITVRTLPAQAQSASTSEMFALKPAVVLASSFDEVLLLDADSLPLIDPDQLFSLRPANQSAVFWPDYWTLLWDAKIWDFIGGWPFGAERYVPSQDSGFMVVCKTCGGWQPLALAFYFNYHSTTYYTAIYYGHFDERRCSSKSPDCRGGHDVPGMGDKDTFQVAWLAFREPYLMMPPAAIAGVLLPRRRLVCGSSFIHRDTNKAAVALHHNSNKWWWKDFAEGKWTSWRTGFMLTHVSSFVNASQAYMADGMNDWRSVTYSTRHDAGRQQPPPSSRWCIVYKGKVVTSTTLTEVGWDIEKVLTKFYTQIYSSPWMMEWATLASGGNALTQCVKETGWESEEWLATAADEDIRNTVIAHLNNLDLGKVPYLQSHSDTHLQRICHSYVQAQSKEKGKAQSASKKEETNSDDASAAGMSKSDDMSS